ncbi:MAG: ferrous iron transport protein B, partial [Dysgonamonadaceae bacterium]|nr:ferrous iron transport protein B [Dysgonamonadaceae bacterium]
MKLSDLKTGEKGIIVKVTGRGAFRKRIVEMGFIRGKAVEVLLNAPLNDPIKYRIMGYEVSLRRSEANLVEVVSEGAAREELNGQAPLTIDDNRLREIAEERSKTINVALVGNPNSGKTSLFNMASGAHERVGNYSGVTVDAREGKFKHKGYTFKLYDLPGTYSLSAYSPEELYVRQQINNGNPDVIINVVAASNLERNLYLTTQLIDMDSNVVIALNMYDELEKSGAKFDYDSLSKMIGMPVVPTVGKTGKGVPELFDKIIDVYEGRCPTSRHIHINYGEELETGITQIRNVLKEDGSIGKDQSKRYISIKLLEGDKEVEAMVHKLPCHEKLFEVGDTQVKNLSKEMKEDLETSFTNARYGFIDGALKQTFVDGPADTMKTTRMIDALVTHKVWGYPVFFLFMFLMFETTFLLGDYPMKWIEWCVRALSGFIGNTMSEGPLKDMITGGIIGGVGSVIVFLPNIVILYMFISFMEDSGYMARAAFIMDKFMQKMGLHGKSFIPLVMGFGCNVPAIMSTRTIESRNARLLTMLVNPLMSCSARLPVYLLFAGAFFGKHGGIALFGLYITGILLAILMSRIFKKFLVKGEDLPFVMELPPYRMPTAKAIFRHMWDKSSQYLRKMGGIILVASIIIWFLEYFPQNEEQNEKYDSQIALIEHQYGNQPDKVEERDSLISEIEHIKRIEHQKGSYIGQIGRFTEPLVRPLGFDWKISVSLLSGMAAKEIVVSTLAVLYV